MNCLSLIRQRYPSMSPVEKRIADCILEDPSKAMNSTVVYIATKAEVSEGSVINFSNALGYKGFSQLKINLAQNISNYSAQDEIRKDDTPGQMMRKLIDRAVASFESTYDTIGSQLECAADMLLRAERIIIVGIGHSRTIAEDLGMRMMRIGLHAMSETDPLLAGIASAQLKEHDVVFIVSNSGRTKEVLSVARMAQSVGAKIIGLTSHTDSPLVKMSDAVLLSVSIEAQNYREPTTARLTQLMIGDCLVECMTHRMGDEAVMRLDRMVEIYEQHREKPGKTGEGS